MSYEVSYVVRVTGVPRTVNQLAARDRLSQPQAFWLVIYTIIYNITNICNTKIGMMRLVACRSTEFALCQQK